MMKLRRRYLAESRLRSPSEGRGPIAGGSANFRSFKLRAKSMLSAAKHPVGYRVRDEIAEKGCDLILRFAQDGCLVELRKIAF
jgi:hypothetical protein